MHRGRQGVCTGGVGGAVVLHVLVRVAFLVGVGLVAAAGAIAARAAAEDGMVERVLSLGVLRTAGLAVH